MTPISLSALMLKEKRSSFLFCSINDTFITQNTDEKLKLNLTDEATSSKRLKHTIKWCIENECNHSYDQAFFINEPTRVIVLSRRMSVIFHNDDWIDIRVSAATRYKSILFSSHFDERIVNAMSDAFLLTEADLLDSPGPRIVYCNDAYIKMCGYSFEEVIGQTPRMLQGPDSSEQAKKNIRIALENWSSVNQRILNYRKDGSQFIVDLNISPLTDETGWYTHWVSVQRDVTSEQADIELVRQSKFILESNHIACWHYHLHDNRVYFDNEMLSIHNTSADTFNSSMDDWCSLIYKPDLKHFRSSLAESINQKKQLDIEYRVRQSKSAIRLLKLTSRMVIDEITGDEMLAGTCFDITDERRSEEEIERHRQVATENARLASIGQLASGVGHEINNPLSVVTASIDVIEAKLEGQTDALELTQPWLNKINSACHRISKIVDGLRSVSLVNREITDLEPINLYTDALETLEFFKEICEPQGISISIIMEAELDNCWFSGDHARFQQILVNLLNNAKDAVMEVKNKQIECVITSNGSFCQLCINDSGIGIDDNVVQHIFDPFVTSKPVGKGTGLGLSITRSIVQSFNGEISVSRMGHLDTSFKIEFPCTIAKTKNAMTKELMQIKRQSVLLIEDEVAVGDSAQALLELLDCRVTRASDGLQAIEKLETEQFDVLLVDLKMPTMDGGSFLQKINSLEIAKNSKKYVVTGEVIGQTDKQFKQLHTFADGILQKPVRKLDLAKILMAS